MSTPETTLLRIACEHCAERGCITCHGEGSVEALAPSHQFMAGWRRITFDPVDSDGQTQIYIVNRQGYPSKGMRLDEAELRELIRAGAAHFAHIDAEAAR